MKRNEQHITGDEAEALFNKVFVEWSINSSQRDYGWDHVVEVFRNRESTGLCFFTQLKGSRNTTYSADTTFISQKLEIDSADYLARILRQPAFLFHADLQSGNLFWFAIQLDKTLLDRLALGTSESLTVRIPTANVLPERFDGFLNDLQKARTVVVSRELLGTRPVEFANAMASQPIERISQVAEDFHEKGFHLELQSAFQKRKEGDIAGAISAIKKVADAASAAGYIEIHFNAVLQAGELEWFRIMGSDVPHALVADSRLATARKLCMIAKRKPRHLHLFALIALKAAELAVTVHATFGVLMNWEVHTKRGSDPIWIAVLNVQVQQSLLVAHRKYSQALRLANATARSRFRWVTPRPIGEIAVTIGTLANLLDTAGFVDAGLQYRHSAFELLKFSAAIATENQSMDELFNAVMYARLLEKDANGEIFEWVRSVIELWPEESTYRKNAEELIERSVARAKGEKIEGDIETTPRQIHYNILTSAGIDPTTELWTSHVELAIRDDDPTRVLIDCQYKLVMPHPVRDLLLDRLALAKANPKIIKCNLYSYLLDGRELDVVDREFKTTFCSSCTDRVPRPSDWKCFENPF